MPDPTYHLNGAFKPTAKRRADLDGPDFFPTPAWDQRLRQETDDICSNPEYLCDRAGRDARISDYQRYGLISGGVALVSAGLTAYLYLSSGPNQASRRSS